MPPKKTKRGAVSTESPSASYEQCALCSQDIIDGKEEALLCEGDGNCNKWMHRYCAGVSSIHYESLKSSPLPFNCSLCVPRTQAALIEELKAKITALTAEVAELRARTETPSPPMSPQLLQIPTSTIAQSGPM